MKRRESKPAKRQKYRAAELLRDAMEEHGFEVYEWEWWHFNYGDAQKYPVMNVEFDEIIKETSTK